MTPEQYRRLRDKESTENSKKKFGAFGPQSFQSRSLKSFQTELEKGKTKHLMPMTNAKKKLSQGKISQRDIPYMQRIGSWDDSDIGKKKKWNEDDKKYDQNFTPNELNWKEGFQPQARGGEKTDSAPKKTFFGLF